MDTHVLDRYILGATILNLKFLYVFQTSASDKSNESRCDGERRRCYVDQALRVVGRTTLI